MCGECVPLKCREVEESHEEGGSVVERGVAGERG